ncbi:uncharacterized protein NPIL_12711 [Nephila pilipes]|uniref:Uncharacterized protein n=1 Tax=Nephila pilipes TaxID=299642 RepID=A0A8X6UDJ1_NEPPI|nr:uncharacterized protein NPIL_12711 [Nephila pilipes]
MVRADTECALQTHTSKKCWRRISTSSILDKPKHDAAAAFRLSTGHDCIVVHLHHIGILTDPIYPLCGFGEKMEMTTCAPMWGSL